MTSTSGYIINKDIKNFPFNIEIYSHVFENKPTEYNSPINLEFSMHHKKKRTSMNEKLYLFDRVNSDNTSDESILNYWTAYYPVEENQKLGEVKFELESFNFAFLGSLDYSIDDAYSNNKELKKSIRPGLNYLLNCNMPRDDCPRTVELMIINRGLGTFNPCKDIIELKCPFCDETLTNIDLIQSFILFKSAGRIEFRFKKIPRVKGFKLENNKIAFFNYNVKDNIKDLVIRILE